MGARPCSGKWSVFLDPARESTSDRMRREAEAKSICAGCSEQMECLAGALQRREPDDVYGGLTAEERAPMYELLDEAEAREAVLVGS